MTDRVPRVLEEAREAYARRAWSTALDGLRAARAEGATTVEDVYALAESAWWLGRVEEALEAYENAYACYLRAEQPRRAAMAALPMAYSLFLRGEQARASGWLSRAQRLLQEQPEGPEHGYLHYLDVEAALADGDFAAAADLARLVQQIGGRHHDPSLSAIGVLGEGRALVRQGRVTTGMAMLDEAMLAALSDELDPAWAGNIYCHLMAACHELADLRRAGEWVRATETWLEGVSGAMLFGGICRVHRVQVMRLRGDWRRAEQEARQVCEELADLSVATAAEGHYERGSLRLLRGDLSGAEEEFRHAHHLGREPQPGLALLRLAQGRADAATASVAAALAAHADDPLARAPLCAAMVESALAAGDLDGARQACEELEEAADTFASSGLQVAAAQARGAVLLAAGAPEQALPPLRAACGRWQQLEAPYECARTRLLLARAYRALGDEDAADLEIDTASATFDRLGAAPDSRRAARLRSRPVLPGGLTPREAEVLALVATGSTNRQIATSLVLSPKTVARHLANIMGKLGLSSRTAAAAYALEHGLVSPPHE